MIDIRPLIPYGIIAILVIVIFFCYSREEHVEIIEVTTVETVTTIDSVFVRDTVFVNIYIPHPDTVVIDNDTLMQYTTNVSDSLIDGRITTWAEGIIRKQTFEYTPRFPVKIVVTDSVFTTTIREVTRTIYPSGIFIGGEMAVIADQADFSPKVQWVRPRYSIGYRYGIITNSHHISLMIRL